MNIQKLSLVMALVGCVSALIAAAPGAQASQTEPVVPPPNPSLAQVAQLARTGPSLWDIKRLVDENGGDFDGSFGDPSFVTNLPNDGAGAAPALPTNFSLAAASHSDNASAYDNCRVETLNFHNVNIPQRQGLPGYDQAGEAHSDVGYGQCLVNGELAPFLISFHGYVGVANCTDSPNISIGGTMYLDGPYGAAYTAAALYIAPPYGLTWGGFHSTAGHASFQGINLTDDNYQTQGRCAGPPTTKIYTGGYLFTADGLENAGGPDYEEPDPGHPGELVDPAAEVPGADENEGYYLAASNPTSALATSPTARAAWVVTLQANGVYKQRGRAVQGSATNIVRGSGVVFQSMTVCVQYRKVSSTQWLGLACRLPDSREHGSTWTSRLRASCIRGTRVYRTTVFGTVHGRRGGHASQYDEGPARVITC